MDRILLDANALISFLTDRNLQQQAQVSDVFEQALHGNLEIVLHQHAIIEMVFVLKNLYRTPQDVIAKMLSDLIHQPGVQLTDELDWREVLKLWPSQIADFGDAILASIALTHKWSVLTFDKSFRRRLKLLRVTLAIR